MVRPLLVTSGARGAGKTLVALALVRALRRRGHRAIGIKPVDTGCAPGPDHDLLSIDGKHLQTASGPPDVPYTIIAPYRVGSPLAPGPALAASGLLLTTAELADTVREGSRWGEVLIVEGPWTATSPLTADGDTLSLAEALSARVVWVVPAEGAVAAALEAAEHTRARGLELRGVVVSAPRGTAALDELVRTLADRLPGVGVVALGPLTGDLEARVTAAEQALEPWARSPYGDDRPS